MKKLLTVVVMVALAGSLYATESRIAAMGESNRFFRDNIEVYGNPAFLYSYTNFVFGEFGTFAERRGWAGINLKLVPNLNVAMAAQRIEGRIHGISEVAGDDISSFKPINGLDLLGNFKAGNLSLGLGLYMSGNKDYSKVVRPNGTVYSENDKSTGVFGLKLGGVLEQSKNTILSGNLGIEFNSYKNKETTNDTTKTTELTGGTDINVGLKAFLPLSNVTIVPVVEFSTFSYKQKYTNDKVSSANFELGSISEMNLAVGVGMNYKTNDALVVAGLSFEYNKVTDESDSTVKVSESSMHLPLVNLGIEKELSSHFTGRFGVRKGFGYHSGKSEPTRGGSTEVSFRGGDNPTLITTGLTAKFGSFMLESALSTDALFNGSWFLSGRQANLNTKLSICYSF